MSNKGGRPRLYESVEQLEQDIEKYFKRCDSKELPYTVAGLAYALGMSTDTLLNYEKRPGYELFFGTIKNAKQRIEAYMIENGLIGNLDKTFSIFLAKANFGYSDQPQQQNTDRKIIIEFEGDDEPE